MATDQTTNPITELSADDSPMTFGGVAAVALTTRLPVALSDGDRADFARAVNHFAARPNTAVLSFNLPTAEEASDYRAKIQAYAAERNLSAGLPKFAAEHMSKPVVDKSSGKITKPAKLVPANKYPKNWNVDTNVTFRLTAHRDESKNGEVTITTVAEAEAAANATE
jgi:hypothetical protein